MPIINRIADFHAEMAEWRHQIHAHPETAFEEHKTAELISQLLLSFGIAVERGIARTGRHPQRICAERPRNRIARRYGCLAHRGTK
jgi:metal-dependent amidase/aminoacylase/carboxypeptidase family protein